MLGFDCPPEIGFQRGQFGFEVDASLFEREQFELTGEVDRFELFGEVQDR